MDDDARRDLSVRRWPSLRIHEDRHHRAWRCGEGHRHLHRTSRRSPTFSSTARAICRWRKCRNSAGRQWDATVAVNLTAAFRTELRSRQAHDPPAQRQIVTSARCFSFLGGRWSSAYAATKHGLAGFTKALLRRARDVQHPGERHRARRTTQRRSRARRRRAIPRPNQRVLDHIPAERWGEPVDLMGALVFLSSRASNYGQRPPAGGRRRLPGPLRRTATHVRPLPHRHRQRLPEHEGRHLRFRGNVGIPRPARCCGPPIVPPRIVQHPDDDL